MLKVRQQRNGAKDLNQCARDRTRLILTGHSHGGAVYTLCGWFNTPTPTKLCPQKPTHKLTADSEVHWQRNDLG